MRTVGHISNLFSAITIQHGYNASDMCEKVLVLMASMTQVMSLCIKYWMDESRIRRNSYLSQSGSKTEITESYGVVTKFSDNLSHWK